MNDLIVCEAQTLEVGDRVPVGKFFWTDRDKCIGFARDAAHGHGLTFGGSVDVGDVLVVLGIEGEEAIVKVEKRILPYGAPCPHGMIFALPISVILSQAGNLKEERVKMKWQKEMAKKYINGNPYE